jgi:hypothetical protein
MKKRQEGAVNKRILRLVVSVAALALSFIALNTARASAEMSCLDIPPVCSWHCGICPSSCEVEECLNNEQCTESWEVWCYDWA